MKVMLFGSLSPRNSRASSLPFSRLLQKRSSLCPPSQTLARAITYSRQKGPCCIHSRKFVSPPKRSLYCVATHSVFSVKKRTPTTVLPSTNRINHTYLAHGQPIWKNHLRKCGIISFAEMISSTEIRSLTGMSSSVETRSTKKRVFPKQPFTSLQRIEEFSTQSRTFQNQTKLLLQSNCNTLRACGGIHLRKFCTSPPPNGQNSLPSEKKKKTAADPLDLGSRQFNRWSLWRFIGAYGSSALFVHESLGILSYLTVFSLIKLGLLDVVAVTNYFGVDISQYAGHTGAEFAFTVLIVKALDVVGLVYVRWMLCLVLTPFVARFIGSFLDRLFFRLFKIDVRDYARSKYTNEFGHDPNFSLPSANQPSETNQIPKDK